MENFFNDKSIFSSDYFFSKDVQKKAYYKNIPDISKWILSAGMLLGRLELFAILVLFFPSFWRN